MKREFVQALPIVAVCLGLMAGPIRAQSTAQIQRGQNPPAQNQGSQTANQEANVMVRATVALTHALDAKKAQPGSTFEARVEQTVHLKNGPELRKGTILVGQVATDDMQVNGQSKLAVRFTQARLANGSSVPVHAIITQLYPPDGFSKDGFPIPQQSQAITNSESNENQWNSNTLKIDQIDAMNNLDLHANVQSQNSGVFVSKRSDVKLMQGSQLELAISAEGNQQTGQNSH